MKSKYAKKSITYQGITDTIKGHANRCGVNVKTVYARISRLKGMLPEDYGYIFDPSSCQGRPRSQKASKLSAGLWEPINPDMRPMAWVV